MAEDPRRLDTIETVLANLKRQIDGLQNTTLNRLATHVHSGGGGGVTDHGALTGLGDDDHTQYHNDSRGDARYYTKSAADTLLAGKSDTSHNHDHGALTGLGDDDHAQYHNDTRGDARYHRLTENVDVPSGKQITVGGSTATALFAGKVATTADDVFSAKVGAETGQRWMVEGDGYNWWGDGTAALDTNLYRGAANQLKTDDSLVVVGGLAVTGVGGILHAYCTSDTSKTSSTTLGDVTGMSVTLASNATYALEAALIYTGNATGDIKFAWSGPAGVGGSWAALGPRVNQNPTAGGERFNYTDFGVLGITTTLNLAADSAFPILAMPKGYVTTGGTGGTFKLQFAQDVSNATATVVKVGSWMKLLRLA